MSPGYIPPSIETIHEPHDIEHVFEHQKGVEEGGMRSGWNGPQNSAAGRLTAVKEAHIDGVRRSGSPKLHHSLKPQPRSRSAERRRASALPISASSRSKVRHTSRRHTVSEHTRQGARTHDDPKHDGQGIQQGYNYEQNPDEQKHASPPLSTLSVSAALDTDSAGSSRSGSTIRQTTFTQLDKQDLGLEGGQAARQGPATPHPDALSYLDPDSPALTGETIEQSTAGDATWGKAESAHSKLSPSARSFSSSSSFWSSPHSDTASERTADTERSASPDRSLDDDSNDAPIPLITSFSNPSVASVSRHTDGGKRGHPTYRYGTPEMPRGTARLPHHSGNVLAPRVPSQGQVKYLPRAEKLPLSGYELLASRISSSSSGVRPRRQSFVSSGSSGTAYQARSRRDSVGSARSGGSVEEPPIKPIYRRFEALNHRLLLHLQDELSELEEQLHRLDTTETQTRRLQNRILPASRRADFLTGGELQWHKTDILGKIGFKLGQYNHVLASFISTRDLPPPPLSDINEYRTYLATHEPITEVETRFLDPVEDLITLAVPTSTSSSSSDSTRSDAEGMAREYFQSLSDDALTPTPERDNGSWQGSARSENSGASEISSAKFSSRPQTGTSGSAVRESETLYESSRASADTANTTKASEMMPPALLHMVIAMAVAVLVPILTFSVIPSFVGRMTVVLLVGLSVAGPLVQSGEVNTAASNMDLYGSIAIYGGAMAVVAGMIG